MSRSQYNWQPDDEIALEYDSCLFGANVVSEMLETRRKPCGVEVYMPI